MVTPLATLVSSAATCKTTSREMGEVNHNDIKMKFQNIGSASGFLALKTRRCDKPSSALCQSH